MQNIDINYIKDQQEKIRNEYIYVRLLIKILCNLHNDNQDVNHNDIIKWVSEELNIDFDEVKQWILFKNNTLLDNMEKKLINSGHMLDYYRLLLEEYEKSQII